MSTDVQVSAAAHFCLRVDANGVVTAASHSNLSQPDMIDVDEAVYTTALTQIGRCSFAGGQITPLPPPTPTPSVPAAISRLQGRLQLQRAGLLGQAEAALQAVGGEAMIWYQDAQSWRRDDPHIAQMATSLTLSGERVDALFTAAAAIV